MSNYKWKQKSLELVKITESVLLCYGFTKQNYEIKKSKEDWKFEKWCLKQSFQKWKAWVDSRTCQAMRRGQMRLVLLKSSMAVLICKPGGFFSSYAQLPSCSYGKGRCLRKSTAAVLTVECNRGKKRKKNFIGFKGGGARNFFPHSCEILKAPVLST